MKRKSINGTSINGPITVAKAASEPIPYTVVATAQNKYPKRQAAAVTALSSTTTQTIERQTTSNIFRSAATTFDKRIE